MKVQSEIVQIIDFETWTPNREIKDSIETSIGILNFVFPELKAKVIVNCDNFVEHGYDIKLRLKIKGGE
jgi:hypothetical protein